jgi:predicted secreted hydrolase
VRRARAAAAAGLALLALAAGAADPPASPDVVPGRSLRFPEDTGAHPEYRTEWWYVTGWLKPVAPAAGDPADLGFQITFFRVRTAADPANPSAFNPAQLVIAHAAVADPVRGRLYRAERVARAGLGLAGAATGRTEAFIRDWRLARDGAAYRARVDAEDFGYDLELTPTGPPLLNGEGGYSRKGPDPRSASYYYSLPQLAVRGRVRRGDRTLDVVGSAWLDQEWSTAYLDAEARGWDWLGVNLADGGALMAFRIRDAAGRARWAAATLRGPGGADRAYGPSEVEFVPGRPWRSPRTGILWPVEWTVRVGARRFTVRPLMDDQEKDARASAGTVYWEGAVRLGEGERPAGRGYLELTGYGDRLRLP